MKLRYWLRALHMVIKAPTLYVWLVKRIDPDCPLPTRLLIAFFQTLQAVGAMFEIALFGYPKEER